MSSHIKKHFSTSIVAAFGKKSVNDSIVMEYADGGDLLKKIF